MSTIPKGATPAPQPAGVPKFAPPSYTRPYPPHSRDFEMQVPKGLVAQARQMQGQGSKDGGGQGGIQM